MLKEFGIGHPPLYHLLQKLVQNFIPFYHPAVVRLVKYLLGQFWWWRRRFIFSSVALPRYFVTGSPVFSNSQCIYISWMYGLILLVSLLLVMAGEKYLQNFQSQRIFSLHRYFYHRDVRRLQFRFARALSLSVTIL